MPTDLILKQAFVWGAGIGVGITAVNGGIVVANAVVTNVKDKIKDRKSSKA